MDGKARSYLSVVDIRQRLQQELSRRQKVNAKYSIRAFARYLDIDFSLLAKFLKGQRRPSQETEEKILKRLNKK